MYNEIEVIDTIHDYKIKMSLLLLFIGEYSGWIQHLDEVGGGWGAAGEATGAQREKVKATAHLRALKEKAVEMVA